MDPRGQRNWAFLKFEVDEIVRAELKEHEDEELESCYRRMCNGKKIAQSVAECYQYTGEDGESASRKLEGHSEPCRKLWMPMNSCHSYIPSWQM